MSTATQRLNAIYGNKSEVLVFGHRGAMAYAPMNTLPAFELAAEQGAHGVELDVHRSKDGHPVIVHDFTVDATSNGSGTVTEMTLAELKALDAGSWFDEKFAGTQIATLDEVFEAVGQALFINVEIKSVGPQTDGVEHCVAECITHHDMADRVIVSCFNPLALKRFRAIMPNVPLGFLYQTQFLEQVQPLTQGMSYEAEHPYFEMVDAALIDAAEGRYINVWTVNDPDEARRLRDLGVHAVITNKPDVILDALT